MTFLKKVQMTNKHTAISSTVWHSTYTLPLSQLPKIKCGV